VAPARPSERAAGHFGPWNAATRQSDQDLEPVMPAPHTAIYFREHKPTFGPYLRRLREERDLGLRGAAAQLGLSFAKLQKMETGGRFRLPGLHVLATIADFYGRPHAEVLHEAGVGVLRPEDIESGDARDRTFAALVLHPDLRPLRMDLAWTEFFSVLQKAQWIEFARRLASATEPAALVEQLLSPSSQCTGWVPR